MQHFEAILKECWPPDRWANVSVLVAVSGGADSVALARAMAAIRHDGSGQLFLAHFNHRLRPEADEDAAFVAQLAAKLGLKCLEGTAEERQLQRGGDGLEAAAREARYRFLTTAAEGVGARYVATAHTQDDQIETILHRILRGTGIAGLAGIPRTRSLSPAVTLIRPLLSMRRTDVTEYLAALSQPIREDATNRDNTLTRNRLRNVLLPQLAAQYNADVQGALVRLGQQAADVQQIVDAAVEDLSRRAVVEASNDRAVVDCARLAPAARHLVRELLVSVWRTAGWPKQDMGYAQWESLAQLALRPEQVAGSKQSSASTVIMLPGNVRAKREGSRLLLTRITS